MMPPTQAGRGQTGRLSLLRAAENIFVFKEVGAPEPENGAGPYVLGIGMTADKITRYFVVLDGKKIPTDNTPLDAFDVFFKTYQVFNIDYQPSLKNYFNFFAHFVYKFALPAKKITAAMRMAENLFE
jgi:hypothetical protein